MNLHHLSIQYTDHLWEAQQWTNRGYEPIECAFGQGSVMGALAMDHHGSESWREGVALRACRDHFGARQKNPQFVVTGTPDADAVLAIIALAALVPQETIPMAFAELVNRRDLDPMNVHLLEETYGEELLFFQQISHLHRDAPSFFRAVRVMCDLLQDGLTPEQRNSIRRKEERRIQLAEHCHIEHIGKNVIFVQGTIWGFDRWYQMAPVVISYSQRHQSVTIGCRDEKKAVELFGESGLLRVFAALGEGWGGRESIGGSPRNQKISVEEARHVAQRVHQLLQESNPT